jgi:hypothetical protein
MRHPFPPIMSPDNAEEPKNPVREPLAFDPFFGKALALSENMLPSANNIELLTQLTSTAAAHQAFVQHRLRRKAASKFDRAPSMLFETEALEQSSGQTAASYHARLFPVGAQVVDLTVGIGGDLLSLCQRGPTTGFELDRLRFEIAEYNLRATGSVAKLQNQDGMAWLRRANAAFVFADPARRTAGRKITDPNLFQPDPIAIAELGQRQRLCVIKLSPLLDDAYLHRIAPRLEFLSVEGECKEVLAICGTDAIPGRFAILVGPDLCVPAHAVPNSVSEAQEFVYDCDPALVRAHALGSICYQANLSPLGDSNGYLTGSARIESPWLKTYRVLYQGPGDLKATRQSLFQLDSETPVIKQRRTGLDLIEMRASFKLKGTRPLLLICYPLERSIRHIVAELLQ